MPAVGEMELPLGVITFLFSDIEGSTRLLRELGDRYGEVLAEHDRLLRGVWAAHGGIVVHAEADSFFVAFIEPGAALNAATEAQRGLAAHAWPPGAEVRVRMGLHTGMAKVRAGDYWGIDVHYAARLCAAAHGGQVLISASTAALVEAAAEDLGEHALKDFPVPRRVFHLPVDGRGSQCFAPPRTLPAGRTNLPAQLSSFIGREREVEKVCSLLSEARTVTLAGAGGVGKTRLALAAAAHLLDGSGDGVWLVELAPLRDPELVAREAARVLGVGQEPGRGMVDTLTNALGARSLLIVLDNCEHLIESAARLTSELLDRCSNVVVLATSREPLGVVGERVVRVPSLELPAACESDPGRLAGSEAVRLFVERAEAHRPGFALDATNAPAVASVCRRLDGIPLAIELAAARLRHLAVAELEARLDQRFRLLRGGPRTALPRQQTLEALIAWSYELLSERERAMLARLSVFAGGFDLAAAEAVCVGDEIDDLDVIDLLGTLVDKSLVGVDDLGEELRYGLLESVRAYAAARLLEHDESELAAVRRAHRDHYLALAETAGVHLHDPEQLRWVNRLELEHDNLRAALASCLADPSPEPGLRLATALTEFRLLRGHALEASKDLIEHLRRGDPDELRLLRGRALADLGQVCASHTSDYSVAIEYGGQALRIAEEEGDNFVAARALGTALAYAHWRRGELDEALATARRGVAHSRAADDPNLLSETLNVEGAVLANLGREPLPVFSEALSISRRQGDRMRSANLLTNIGLTELAAGQLVAARAHLREALQLSRELQVGHVLATALHNLGLVAYLDGDREGAQRYFSEALEMARRTAQPSGSLYSLFGFTLAPGPSGETDIAARLHGAVDALFDQLSERLDAFELTLWEADEARLRASLGDDSFQAAYQAGRALSLDEAIALSTLSTAG